jgi:hypothetical protein
MVPMAYCPPRISARNASAIWRYRGLGAVISFLAVTHASMMEGALL